MQLVLRGVPEGLLEGLLEKITENREQLPDLQQAIDIAKAAIEEIPFEKPVYFLNVCPAKVTMRQPERVHTLTPQR